MSVAKTHPLSLFPYRDKYDDDIRMVRSRRMGGGQEDVYICSVPSIGPPLATPGTPHLPLPLRCLLILLRDHARSSNHQQQLPSGWNQEELSPGERIIIVTSGKKRRQKQQQRRNLTREQGAFQMIIYSTLT